MIPGKDFVPVVQVKHLAMEPETLKCEAGTAILLKIAYSNEHANRKFLFLIEETEEETPPLSEGQQYQFQTPLTAGTFTLVCLNYPRLTCTIEAESIQSKPEELNEGTEERVEEAEQPRAASPLCDLTEVVQQRDQQIKEAQEGGEEERNNSHSKSDFADYQRILSDEDMRYDYMPNKYLRYFKEEFKLWRDFFEQPPPAPSPPLPRKELSNRKQTSREEASSGSLSLSQRESQKEESVISQLRSQQEMSEMQEDENLNRTKIMKKTNSEYCFNVDRDSEKPTPSPSKRKQINTNTSSPNPRTEQSQTDSFLDWACSWAEQQQLAPLIVPRLPDRHLVRQWHSFLQNKFKISEIMYG